MTALPESGLARRSFVGEGRGNRRRPLWAQSLLLGLFMALAGSSCVLDAPPEYSEPRRTIPTLYGISPTNTQIVAVSSGTNAIFSVKIQSEDAGTPLLADLYENWGEEQRRLGGVTALVSASTLTDKNRSITRTWGVPAEQGCKRISLVVMHADNIENTDGGASRIVDPNDVAVVTWWVSIDGATNCAVTTGGQ